MPPAAVETCRFDAEAQLDWWISNEPVAYEAAVAGMEERVAAIHEGRSPETVWLLEHPSLYTAGTSANASDVLDANGLTVVRTGRGGQVTYHGPGQRIAYVMVDVRQRFNGDVRGLVRALEAWMIAVLAVFQIPARTYPGRVGVWLDDPARPSNPAFAKKVAALGIRVRRGISFHGVALNVSPDLAAYDGIVPCGIKDAGVTSLENEGVIVGRADVDAALQAALPAVLAHVATPAFTG